MCNITTTVNPTVAGTVMGAGSYDSASVATLIAIPNSGYKFTNWTSNGAVISTSSVLNITVVRDTALMANLEEDIEFFDVEIGGINPVGAGTVSGSGKYEKNTSVTLTANPNPDFEFVNWTSNGIEISTENPFTFILTQDTVINANFNYVSITENTLISSIRILPNPVHNDAIIEINCLASQPNTVITILDLSGREILTVYSGLLDEGINNFPIPNHYSLANGSYFVSISNNKGRKVERFVVAR